MRSKEVLQLLKVSRVTLSTYVRKGIIKVNLMANGFYDYDEQSIYDFLGINNDRVNIIYARVSTHKQKSDLDRQLKFLQKYCSDNDISIDQAYSEISSGLDLDRPKFSQLLELVFENKIDTIYITHRDRLTRLSFLTLKSILLKFGTKIVVIKDKKHQDNELFDEILSIMHIFATKEYSNRRK
jgi:putative resolvase